MQFSALHGMPSWSPTSITQLLSWASRQCSMARWSVVGLSGMVSFLSRPPAWAIWEVTPIWINRLAMRFPPHRFNRFGWFCALNTRPVVDRRRAHIPCILMIGIPPGGTRKPAPPHPGQITPVDIPPSPLQAVQRGQPAAIASSARRCAAASAVSGLPPFHVRLVFIFQTFLSRRCRPCRATMMTYRIKR